MRCNAAMYMYLFNKIIKFSAISILAEKYYKFLEWRSNPTIRIVLLIDTCILYFYDLKSRFKFSCIFAGSDADLPSAEDLPWVLLVRRLLRLLCARDASGGATRRRHRPH
jgi:hypothetical protein